MIIEMNLWGALPVNLFFFEPPYFNMNQIPNLSFV